MVVKHKHRGQGSYPAFFLRVLLVILILVGMGALVVQRKKAAQAAVPYGMKSVTVMWQRWCNSPWKAHTAIRA